MNDINSTPEVKSAAREVERRKAELSRSIRDAGESGEQMARRFGDQLKPVLIGVAVAVGAAALVGVAALVVRRRRHAGWLAPQPQRPSALAAVARSAGVALLRMVALHAARTLAQRVSAAALEPAPAPSFRAQ